MPNEVQDPGWTVVSNRKGKAKMQERDGRTFREVAKGIKIVEGGGSLTVWAKVQATSLSSKGHNKAVISAFTAFSYKSPKKRAHDEDIVEEDSMPSVEIRGEYQRGANTSVGDSPNPIP
ncbi:hypothetical protein ACE6H2_026438 [Prunus campanulata]